MTSKLRQPQARRIWPLFVLLAVFCFAALIFSAAYPSAARVNEAPAAAGAAQTPAQGEAAACSDCPQEPADLIAFRQTVGVPVTAVIVELRGVPGVIRKMMAEQEGRALPFREITDYALQLRANQNELLGTLAERGVRAMMREADVVQIDGSVRHVEYRFSYLLNGFVAYVATEDIERLRALPEVLAVSEAEQHRFLLDKAIDYSLGTAPTSAARRAAVYGATQELSPAGATGHPEAPHLTAADGYEGQGMNIAVIDSGVDWRHPMFGGQGLATPIPRVSGQPESAADNRKVIYYYSLSSPGDLTDDFGHGTHVASCAAGYEVDGSTTPRLGYGTGPSGTGIGPTPNGARLHGTAPQARIMAYKVCGPTNACPGDIPLSIEDAASPFTLVSSGNAGPTPVPKPVADVINLSLGDTAGDPSGATSRAANNAALAGTIMVSSAGNAGPGLGTVGAPSTATLTISVAASLDPGSTDVADVLAPCQITGEVYLSLPPACGPPTGASGPPPETGAASNANAPQPGERQAIRLFPVAGGAPLPNGSLSAHYVYVEDPNTTPATVRNRIALVRGGTGTFFNIVNAVAAQQPAAIILRDDRESLTALVVAGNIPVYNVNTETTNYLINRISDTDSDANNDGRDDVAPGAISQFPLRLSEAAAPENFLPAMAGFSSRGPNDHANARFRTVKPDVTAPGVGIVGATTPTGLPSETIGMANPVGYAPANGTSFSGPITAGAMALIRQRVRTELGLDTTDTSDPDYRAKRFDVVTISRALLMNNATNLRLANGTPQGSGAASTASINEMGAGHINIAAALQARAIMVAPTVLLTTPREFNAPSGGLPPGDLDAQGNLRVLIPSSSFGAVPVVGVNATVVRWREVIIRDITGTGGGTYNLSFQNNRNATDAGFAVSFTATANSNTPISSISVPAGGQASFFVRVAADGALVNVDQKEFQWYVTATQVSTAQSLRMPFYYRATRANIPNIDAPVQTLPENTEQPPPSGSDCVGDTDGSYRIHWSYTAPAGGPPPVGFRVQEGTRSDEVFFDNADEALVAGANSRWTGSAQWTTQTHPNTGSPAYYIPNAAEQNESLTMINAVALPAGGATLTFTTTHDFEDGFDNGFVEVSADGGAFVTVLTLANDFSGTRSVDLSPFAGKEIKVRFRMVSDLLNGEHDPVPLGWWVEDIRLSSDDFRTLADVGPGVTSLDVVRPNGTYIYRIAGLFETELGAVAGPYSNLRCVIVSGVNAVLQFSANTFTVTEGCVPALITVTRSGSTSDAVAVDYVTSDGTATQRRDYTYAAGRLTFAAGETSKSFNILITEDGYAEGPETLTITLANAVGNAVLGSPVTATLQINDNDTQDSATNPIDDAANFVCQHYHDFLNRQGDAEGIAFWTAQIAQCGNDAACLEDQRQRVSTAFFLSIEFQQTGYLVFRFQRASFATLPAYTQFLRDTRGISENVIVGQPGWEQQLAANQQAFALEWVARPEFTARYPSSLTREQFVDALFANAEVTPTQVERQEALDAYGDGSAAGRAAALRKVADSGSVYNRQYNPGFVLMQYFGYLRRHPSEPPDNNLDGYNFWLQKMNDNSEAGEDVRDESVALRRAERAQMVLAFISSIEYRERFGR